MFWYESNMNLIDSSQTRFPRIGGYIYTYTWELYTMHFKLRALILSNLSLAVSEFEKYG